uniref:Uncharacterized protein n=1 Tax=Emiliania huxleyi TaxID=2903 RepID=A0A7S3SNB7_EMIHU
MGQRKKLRESCDAALRPLYAEGAAVCSELEPSAASAASASEHAPTAAVPQQMLPGPRFVWTVRVAAPCARRPVPSSAQSPSRQRHFQFPRSGRAAPPRWKLPLRLPSTHFYRSLFSYFPPSAGQAPPSGCSARASS